MNSVDVETVSLYNDNLNNNLHFIKKKKKKRQNVFETTAGVLC